VALAVKTAEHSFCLDFFASFFIKKKRRRKESFCKWQYKK